ncbi:uncharacterized protein LOC143204995 [Rhynchophorus ferrugineus]|uniref:uncharacterized protein LOC143204995 n=1 Tax=Rhynchophorus ferrugineus TaxID=354439 RepID=UPI003FCE36CD
MSTLREEIYKILTSIAQVRCIKNCSFDYDINSDSGDGFISELFIATIKDVDNDAALNVAIKKAPDTTLFSDVFNNEYVFYHQVFPALDAFQRELGVSEPFVNIPQFYLGSVEPHKQFIAMEDLKIQGYQIHEKSSCLDRKHLEYIFKTYGQLHALNFAFKTLRPEEFRNIADEAYHGFIELRDVMVPPVKDCLEACMKEFSREQVGTENENILERCRWVYDNMAECYDRSTQYKGRYSCITHGDCWSNNLFFKYSENGEVEDLKLIDFQFWKEDTPIHDLSYFFYSGASKEDFDRLDQYLELYHDSFVQYAKQFGCDGYQLFPLDVLKAEWRIYGLFGILMGIMLWRIKLTTRESCQEFTQANSRDNLDGWDKILMKAQETEEFKRRSKDIMRHAVEYKII